MWFSSSLACLGFAELVKAVNLSFPGFGTLPVISSNVSLHRCPSLLWDSNGMNGDLLIVCHGSPGSCSFSFFPVLFLCCIGWKFSMDLSICSLIGSSHGHLLSPPNVCFCVLFCFVFCFRYFIVQFYNLYLVFCSFCFSAENFYLPIHFKRIFLYHMEHSYNRCFKVFIRWLQQCSMLGGAPSVVILLRVFVVPWMPGNFGLLGLSLIF